MQYVSGRSVHATLVTAFLAGIAGVVGSYALAGYTQRFVAASKFSRSHSRGSGRNVAGTAPVP